MEILPAEMEYFAPINPISRCRSTLFRAFRAFFSKVLSFPPVRLGRQAWTANTGCSRRLAQVATPLRLPDAEREITVSLPVYRTRPGTHHAVPLLGKSRR